MERPNSNIFWREKAVTSESRASTYERLMAGEFCEHLEVLPLDDLRATYSKTYSATLVDGNVTWNSCGARHTIIFHKQYFFYQNVPLDNNVQLGASFAYIDIIPVAGKFGCIVYHPSSGVAFTKLTHSIIKEPKSLKTSPYSDLKAFQLPFSVFEGPDRLFLSDPVATICKSIEELEQLTEMIFEDDLDGLDYVRGAVLKIDDEKFGLCRHLHDEPGVSITVNRSSKSAGDSLDTLLIAFGLTSKDLDWRHPSLTFTPHELWRQDDNGNEALIETCVCRADALEKARIFTDRGHKQLYWVTAVK